MSLFEELRKKQREQPRAWDYLRWAVVAVLVAIAVVAAVVLLILAIHPEGAREFIDGVLHHIYVHYGLIPVLVLLLIVVVAAVAFVVQLIFTYIVYWKAYSEKRGQDAGTWKPELVDKQERKTGWTRGYYQGVVLLVTNAMMAVLIIAAGIYGLGYVGIDVAEQPEFCTMCHEVMIKPYESYAASTHKGIHCGACHNDPGIKGFVKGEVIAPMKEGWLQAAGEYHLEDGHLLPGAVPINNESCLASECHKEKRLREEEFHYKGFVFRHDKHIDLKHGGQVLTCDACHAYDKQVHMKVDNNTCGLCHFSAKMAIKEPTCDACHALRTKLKDEAKELMHAQAADFEKQPCNDCHTALKSPLILHEEACGERCHKRHGRDVKLSEFAGGTEEVHKTHVHAACMTCHERAHHKIDHTKFTTARMVTFGRPFTHEKHDQDCHVCHARIEKRFALKLKDKYDCSACHHAPERMEDKSCDDCHEQRKSEAFGKKFSHESHGDDCAKCHVDGAKNLRLKLKSSADCTSCHHDGVEDPDSCDLCHDLRKIEAFGRKFVHKAHGSDCKQCHVDGTKNLQLKLKGRADCNKCHHESADPETCEGCHDTQAGFFKGAKKFGFDETPSMKAEMETGCDACHGDVKKFEPDAVKKSCTTCHEEDDADYDYAKLVGKGRKALGDAMTKLDGLQEGIAAAEKRGLKAEELAGPRKAVDEVARMLAFLRKDASFGLHNPGLFGEYVSKMDEMLDEALKQLKE